MAHIDLVYLRSPAVLLYVLLFVCGCARKVAGRSAEAPGAGRRPKMIVPARRETEVACPHTAANRAPASNGAVRSAVRQKVRRTLAGNSSPIDISVVDGIATLLGYVDDQLVARRAVQAALVVQGVRAVVDRLLIPRTGEDPRWLERSIRAALRASPTVESYELGLRVRDGTVRLDGVVQSYTERQAAEDLAWSVRGVFRVNNSIRVTRSSVRNDPEIAADVEYELLADAYLNDNPIQVQVARGIVLLSGRVGSAFERERAVARAWVVGVRGVDDQALRIAPTPEDCLERQYEPQLPDREISTTIADALRFDPRVGSREIQIFSQAGVVTLTGAVAAASARTAAAGDAANTLGVRWVQNELRVGLSCEEGSGPCADAR